MRFLKDNPLLVAVIGGAIGCILAGIALFYLFEYRAEKIAKTALIARVNSADEFLDKNMIDDALAIYEDILKTATARKYSEIYAHVKHNEGICYFDLAYGGEKEENLSRAILAYEESLEIYIVEKYPVCYAINQNNLGVAYGALSEIRDKEENLSKAIQAYKEVLKIYTKEEYPLYYEIVTSNMGIAKRKMEK